MNKIKTLIASTAFIVCSTAASWAVTFDFGTAQSGDVPSLTFSQDGFTVVATAKATDNAGNVLSGSDGIAKVNQTSFTGPNVGGLGVRSKDDSNHAIDGAVDINDLLLLTFNKAVRIVSISFALVDNRFGGDKAYITVDGSNQGNKSIVGFAFPNFETVNLVGKTFGIGALGKTDEFKVRAITVTPVPLPPAVLMLATGVAGIAALARRKRK